MNYDSLLCSKSLTRTRRRSPLDALDHMATSKLGPVQIASPRAQDLPRKRLDLPKLIPGDPVANPSSLWFKSDGYYDRAIEAYEKANGGREAPGRRDDKTSHPWKKSELPRGRPVAMNHYFSTVEESPRAFGGNKAMEEKAMSSPRWKPKPGFYENMQDLIPNRPESYIKNLRGAFARDVTEVEKMSWHPNKAPPKKTGECRPDPFHYAAAYSLRGRAFDEAAVATDYQTTTGFFFSGPASWK